MTKGKKEHKVSKWYRLERKVGKNQTYEVTVDMLYGANTFAKLKEMMQEIETEFPEYENYRIEMVEEYYPYEESTYKVFYVEGFREESDDEFKARLEARDSYAAEREALERAQYEALKKKFGD